MELEQLTQHIGAQGGVMKQFSRFMANAEIRGMEGLEYAIKSFIKSENFDDFEGEAIEGLVEFMAQQSGREDITEVMAESIGWGFALAVKHLFKKGSVAQIELVSTFLLRIQDKEQAERDPLTVMRELSAYDPLNRYPDDQTKQLLWLMRHMERPFALTYPDADGKTKTMNLSSPEATRAAALMEPIMKDVQSWEDEEADLAGGISQYVEKPFPSESEAESPSNSPKAPDGFRGGPLEWMDLKYQEMKKNVGKVSFTMNAYQDGYSDYGVDINAKTFEEIIAARKAFKDAAKPTPSPNHPDVITQAEIADLFRQEYATYDTFLAIRARMDAGATVEAGRYKAKTENEEHCYVSGFGNGGVYVSDEGEPAESLANLAETLQEAEGDVDRQAEESIRVDVDGLRKEFARLSETDGARLQILLGVWDGTETGAEVLLSEVEFHTVLAVLKGMRQGKKVLSVSATPDLALEDLQEAHRALEFRVHKMQPGAGYDPEDLLRMDGDGDEIWSEESVHIGVPSSVCVYVMDEVTPAETVRFLRKITAAIEKTGLPHDKRVTYTDHPILEHTEAINGRMRQQKPGSIGDPVLADEAVAAFKKFSDSVRPSTQ